MSYRDNKGLISQLLSFNCHSKNSYWLIATTSGKLLEYVQGTYKDVVHYAVNLEGFDYNSRITEISVVQIDADTLSKRDKYLEEKVILETRLRAINELLATLPKGRV